MLQTAAQGLKGRNKRRVYAAKDGGSPYFYNNQGQKVAINYDASLTEDAWRQLDDYVVQETYRRFTGVADLIASGLVSPISDIGVMTHQHEAASDLGEANVSMDARTPGNEEDVNYLSSTRAVPIIYKDSSLSGRRLAAGKSIRSLEDLDLTQIDVATRTVAQQAEELLFNGSTAFSSTAPIYGYTSHPNRIQYTIPTSWSTATAGAIVSDILTMLQAGMDDGYAPGPINYMLYVGSDVYMRFEEDHKPESERTLRERVEAIPGIQGVKFSPNLAADNVVLVALERDVVEWARFNDVSTDEWQLNQWEVKYRTWMIATPVVKSTFGGSSGVVHGAV